MAAVIESWFRQDLQKLVQVHYLDGSLFSNNGNGNRIGVELTNGGEDYTVTGTVSGYAVLADGSTVPCTGAKSGNKASILVPPAAYLPGNIFITIFLTEGTTVTTLAAVSSTVIQARTDNQVSPGSVVTDWTNTINAAMQSVETAAANLGKIVATPYAQLTFPVPLGKHTYYNNNLYRCTTPIATSEDFTAAHWSSALNLGDEVSDLKSAILDKFNAVLNGVDYSYQTTTTTGNHTKTLGFTILSGTTVEVYNLSSTTDITVIFRDANDNSMPAETINKGKHKTITLTLDAVKVRSYVSGTDWNFRIVYGDNLQGQITNNTNTIKNLKTHNVAFYDGYYNSAGSIVESTENGVKYTDKLECFSGQKLHVSLALASTPSAFWLAKGEWKKDGTFVRTNITTTTVSGYAFDYVPDETVERVAFMFYGWASYTFEILSETDIQTVYEAATKAGIMRCSYAFDSHRVKGINHRGYNTVAPENTIPAFRLSVENGFSFVETDVRFTSDGVPVLLHDATVDRTSNGTGNIADMTYEQARALDFGSWKSATYAGTKIPSFKEFIVFCRDTAIFPYIEVSGAEFTVAQLKLLIDIVKKYGMERYVTWISFYKSNLVKISNLDECARVGRLPSTTLTDGIASGMSDLMTGRNEAFVSVDINYLTSETVELCQQYGILLETWTINSENTMRNLSDYISGVTSDSVNFETVIRAKALGE